MSIQEIYCLQLPIWFVNCSAHFLLVTSQQVQTQKLQVWASAIYNTRRATTTDITTIDITKMIAESWKNGIGRQVSWTQGTLTRTSSHHERWLKQDFLSWDPQIDWSWVLTAAYLKPRIRWEFRDQISVGSWRWCHSPRSKTLADGRHSICQSAIRG